MARFAFCAGKNMARGFASRTNAIVTTDASRRDVAMIKIGDGPIARIVMAGVAIGADRGRHVGRGFADGATCRK